MLTSILFTILASVAAALANAEPKQCTTTVVEANEGCCAAPAAETTTSIDCHGCAIKINPGPRCALLCETTRTVPTSTRTHTVCKAPATPDPLPVKIMTTLTTYSKSSTSAVAPSKPCTTAFHDTNTGCCGPRPAKTVTKTVDCHGCVGVNVVGPHCDIACERTLTDPLFISTRTVCATGASQT